MQVDYKRNLGWLATAVMSILCYWTIPDLLFRNLNEPYTISLIGLIGYPVILLLMIMGGILFLRGASFQRSMLKKRLTAIWSSNTHLFTNINNVLKGLVQFSFI